jgi:tetratricopeptide (TPR) repeat protein
VLTNKGALARAREEPAVARNAHEDGLDLARELGSRHLVAENIDGLGLLAAAAGDVHDARQYFERSLAIKRELGVTHGIAQTLSDLGWSCRTIGARRRAREHLEEAERLASDVKDPSLLATCRAQLGTLAVERGDISRATQWVNQAVEALEGAGAIGTDRARPIERLDEVVAVALDAGYQEAPRDWCQRVTTLLQGRDDVDAECFDDHRVRSAG